MTLFVKPLIAVTVIGGLILGGSLPAFGANSNGTGKMKPKAKVTQKKTAAKKKRAAATQQKSDAKQKPRGNGQPLVRKDPAARKAELDKLLKDGKITQAQYDKMLAAKPGEGMQPGDRKPPTEADRKAKLDQLLKDGKITQDQYDRMIKQGPLGPPKPAN